MSEDIVLTEEKNGALWLTLNRPAVMNALNFDLIDALHAQIDRVRYETRVRTVVITGAGEKAFCAGADLKERAALSDLQVKRFIANLGTLFCAIENLNKPVIAAINGVALGGGTELALACDIRIASINASLGLTETRLAIIPGGGGTQRLPRLIGPGKAKELIFTGRRVSADEALILAMVNHVCAKDDLIDTCSEMAEMIGQGGPIAIEQAKYAINCGLGTDLATGLSIESNAYWLTVPTEDRREALRAFREKRKPVFKGK